MTVGNLGYDGKKPNKNKKQCWNSRNIIYHRAKQKIAATFINVAILYLYIQFQWCDSLARYLLHYIHRPWWEKFGSVLESNTQHSSSISILIIIYILYYIYYLYWEKYRTSATIIDGIYNIRNEMVVYYYIKDMLPKISWSKKLVVKKVFWLRSLGSSCLM